MKDFIKRSKRHSKGGPSVEKREQIDKEHMYVVENGEIKPLKDIEFPDNMSQDYPPKTGNFLKCFTF